jgi:hypothetical protein
MKRAAAIVIATATFNAALACGMTTADSSPSHASNADAAQTSDGTTRRADAPPFAQPGPPSEPPTSEPPANDDPPCPAPGSKCATDLEYQCEGTFGPSVAICVGGRACSHVIVVDVDPMIGQDAPCPEVAPEAFSACDGPFGPYGCTYACGCDATSHRLQCNDGIWCGDPVPKNAGACVRHPNASECDAGAD